MLPKNRSERPFLRVFTAIGGVSTAADGGSRGSSGRPAEPQFSREGIAVTGCWLWASGVGGIQSLTHRP
jgi:hypothetical protein